MLENAYKHGVERSTTPVELRVEARRNGEVLEITVRNSGSLTLPVIEGIGLRNCRERLALLHGSSASLTLTNDAHDVVARLTLPWRRQT